MPYASEAQRGYLHAVHPEIAARWDAEEKKHSGKKDKPKRKKPKPKGQPKGQPKGRVSKLLVPVSDDPYFNADIAQKTFNLVMKMDDDTAQVFCHIVASDLFEQEVENNLGTLQRRLNAVVAKRYAAVKSVIAKRADEPRAQQLWETVVELEKASDPKHNPYYYGYKWDPNDFRRDPATGRFMVKISHTMTTPLKEKHADAMFGDSGKHLKDNSALRAKYQDEYRQVAGFLDMAAQAHGGSGNIDVIYHTRDKAGHVFSTMSNSTKPPRDILGQEDTDLIAVEAKPTTLSAGGAAYQLAGAFGQELTPEQMDRANKAGPQFAGFVRGWASAGTNENANDRLYQRLQSSGSMMNNLGASGGKVQLAGQMAQIVGQYGPEAEKVIGPTARKTAYRYRGTETTPDEKLVDVYGDEITDAKKYGVIKPTPETQAKIDERLMTTRQRLTGVPGAGRGDMRSQMVRRATGAQERQVEAVTPSILQVAQARAGEIHDQSREPTWAERGMGTAVVSEYLRLKIPSRRLYELHLAAGNTPPSEGVIIDSKGRLAAQAIGYGDDHYLPFNLKNLKALKGGEYVRNRSVGGLTSEDIYTGLMTGARRVTVVSRSGTFSMEFAPDFRGGRRHNDKARRMTRRYEQILDAVQSGQVERQEIPPQWRKAIENEVKTDPYYQNADKQTIYDEIETRLKEFKENPKIEGRDLDRAEVLINAAKAQANMGLMSESDAKDYEASVMKELHDMKEVRFRLNGIGYDAALKSLQEQFPYYIHDVRNKPTRREDNLEFEQDKGYVEPGRNRPTKAQAGLYGTSANKGQKFSASHADYQRGRNGNEKWTGTDGQRAAAVPQPGEETPDGTTGTTGTTSTSDRKTEENRSRDMFAQEQKRMSARDAGAELFGFLKKFALWDPDMKPLWWDDMDKSQMKERLKDPAFAKEFNDTLEKFAPQWGGPQGIQNFGSQYSNYKRARGASESVKFQRALAADYPEYPLTFDDLDGDESGYHAGATVSDVKRAMHAVDTKKPTGSFTTTRPLSQLGENELQQELNATVQVRNVLFPTDPSLRPADPKYALDALKKEHPTSPSVDVMLKLTSQQNLDDHLEKIHRIRFLMIQEEEAEKRGTSVRNVRTGTPNPGTPGDNGGTSTPVKTKPAPTHPIKQAPSVEEIQENLRLKRQTTDRYVAALDAYGKQLRDLQIDASGTERSNLIRATSTVETLKNQISTNRHGPELIDDHVKKKLGYLYDEFKVHLDGST